MAARRSVPPGSMKSPPLDREEKAILAKIRRYEAKEARDEEREAQKLASKALTQPMELRSAALTQPMELRSAGPAAASSMEFVLTNTTPGASGKELVSSAEELRIALEDFAKKVEDIKTLWNVLRNSPEEQHIAYMAVEAMKQRFQESMPSATAVKAVQQAVQVIGKPAGAESIKPGRSGNSGEPTLASMDCDGIDDWSNPASKNYGEFLVALGYGAEGSTSIFVGDIPMVVTVDQLQVMIGVKAEIVRYHENRKFGHAKIVLSKLDVVRVLELQLTVSGQKLRVARWQSKAPSHRVPAVATNRRKSEMAKQARQERKSEAVKQARQEQARFVADLLHAQAAPNVRRLYSQVTSNTAEARMKSMETAIHGVRQLLERLTKHRQ